MHRAVKDPVCRILDINEFWIPDGTLREKAACD
jgi:hypothetical protein